MLLLKGGGDWNMFDTEYMANNTCLHALIINLISVYFGATHSLKILWVGWTSEKLYVKKFLDPRNLYYHVAGVNIMWL